LPKSCQKVVKNCPKVFKNVKKWSKSGQKVSKMCPNFRHTWKKPNKNNGAIEEKVRWCNSKKVNSKNKKQKIVRNVT
jgi:hypothetical protein